MRRPIFRSLAASAGSGPKAARLRGLPGRHISLYKDSGGADSGEAFVL